MSLLLEIREAIQEELSIAEDVRQKAAEIKERIIEDIKIQEKGKSEIENTVEKNGSFSEDFLGARLSISYVYYNFLTPEALKNAEGKHDYLTAYSTKVGKNLWLIRLKCYGVSGGLNERELADSIQHELEHVYQGKMGSRQLIEPDANYLRIEDELSSKNEETRRLAEIAYIAHRSEQDAFINGLYAFLANAKTPIPSWEDIQGTEAYAWLEKIANNLAFFRERMGDLKLRKKCRERYGKSLGRFLSLAQKTYDRMKRKIAKVLIKLRNDYGENNPPVRVNTKGGGRTPYFTD